MTIKEAKALREKAESDISQILKSIQLSTSLEFIGIDVQMEKMITGPNKIISVSIKLKV